MHSLTEFLERNAAEGGFSVVEVNDTASERDDCICVNLSHLRELDRCREFNEGAKKRMGAKVSGALRIPYACLVCPGYNINHDSLKPYSYEELGKAWEFIQCISVASTEATRSLVKRMRRGRSLEGYRLHMGMVETRYTTMPPDDISREVRNLGDLALRPAPNPTGMVHSSLHVLTIGNSLALRSSLTLGLPPPPPPYQTAHVLPDETETSCTDVLSSQY